MAGCVFRCISRQLLGTSIDHLDTGCIFKYGFYIRETYVFRTKNDILVKIENGSCLSRVRNNCLSCSRGRLCGYLEHTRTVNDDLGIKYLFEIRGKSTAGYRYIYAQIVPTWKSVLYTLWLWSWIVQAGEKNWNIVFLDLNSTFLTAKLRSKLCRRGTVVKV